MLRIKPWQKFEKATVSEQKKNSQHLRQNVVNFQKRLIPTLLIKHFLQFYM